MMERLPNKCSQSPPNEAVPFPPLPRGVDGGVTHSDSTAINPVTDG